MNEGSNVAKHVVDTTQIRVENGGEFGNDGRILFNLRKSKFAFQCFERVADFGVVIDVLFDRLDDIHHIGVH